MNLKPVTASFICCYNFVMLCIFIINLMQRINTAKPRNNKKTGKTDDKGDKTPDKAAKTVHMFWKGIAIAFIAVFCIILIFGIIRWQHFRPQYAQYEMPKIPQQPLIGSVKDVISADLSNSGENISDYDVQVSDNIRKFPREGMDKNIIQVSLYAGTKRHLYLVDADSGVIVMHSETSVYGWMQNLTLQPERRRWFFMGDDRKSHGVQK